MSESLNNIRKRKTPDRYGNFGNLDDETTDDEPFLDNSMDDQNFVPSPAKIVATVKRSKFDHNANKPSPSQTDVNHLFEELLQPQNVLENSSISDQIENFQSKENAKIETESIDTASYENIFEAISYLKQSTDQILARLSTIEEHLLRNPKRTILSKEQPNGNEELERKRSFLISIGLPFTDLSSLQTFEKQLSDPKFKESVVNCNSYLFCNFSL